MELIKKACDAYARGQLIEPRILYNTFLVPQATSALPRPIVRSADGAYRNGEQFPLRLTHLTLTSRALTSDGTAENTAAAMRGQGPNTADPWGSTAGSMAPVTGLATTMPVAKAASSARTGIKKGRA